MKETNDNLRFFRGLPLAILLSLLIAWLGYELGTAIAAAVKSLW